MIPIRAFLSTPFAVPALELSPSPGLESCCGLTFLGCLRPPPNLLQPTLILHQYLRQYMYSMRSCCSSGQYEGSQVGDKAGYQEICSDVSKLSPSQQSLLKSDIGCWQRVGCVDDEYSDACRIPSELLDAVTAPPDTHPPAGCCI